MVKAPLSSLSLHPRKSKYAPGDPFTLRSSRGSSSASAASSLMLLLLLLLLVLLLFAD